MGKKVFVSLSHPFSAEIPRWPYFDKPKIEGAHTMAKGGVLTQTITCPMHTGTHCDAPRHVMEIEFNGKRARYTHEMPLDAYTGDAVCLPIEIERWGLILTEHNIKRNGSQRITAINGQGTKHRVRIEPQEHGGTKLSVRLEPGHSEGASLRMIEQILEIAQGG